MHLGDRVRLVDGHQGVDQTESGSDQLSGPGLPLPSPGPLLPLLGRHSRHTANWDHDTPGERL